MSVIKKIKYNLENFYYKKRYKKNFDFEMTKVSHEKVFGYLGL